MTFFLLMISLLYYIILTLFKLRQKSGNYSHNLFICFVVFAIENRNLKLFCRLNYWFLKSSSFSRIESVSVIYDCHLAVISKVGEISQVFRFCPQFDSRPNHLHIVGQTCDKEPTCQTLFRWPSKCSPLPKPNVLI